MLKDVFTGLVRQYTTNEVHAEQLWLEIETRYSEPSRHYHTLSHLENLYTQLSGAKTLAADWDTLLFTLFYHDVIYNTKKNDNEEQSAEFAAERMMSIAVPEEKIAQCRRQILATKKHEPSGDRDTDLFTDADLSILGSDRETYSRYCKQVREEYSIYPYLLYRSGRKKALEHFLQMDRIYKTDHFFGKFELQARENMRRELASL